MKLIPIVAVVAFCLAFAAPAGASMTVTNVAFNQQSGDPNCVVPLPPKGGTGSASYQFAEYTLTWEWSIPAEIKAGATASIKVTVQMSGNGGASADIALQAPPEFGVGPAGAPTHIEARVPVGAPGTTTAQQAFTFTPTRDFTTGEKLRLSVGVGPKCANIGYEYTATAAPSGCPGGRVAWSSPVVLMRCVTKSLTAPAPGKSATLTSPTLSGTAPKTDVTATGDVQKTTIVGEGERTGATATGEAVAACWLIGPDALDLKGLGAEQKKVLRSFFKGLEASPRKTLGACIELVKALQRVDPVVARTAGAGCQAQRLSISMNLRKGKVVSATPVVTARVPSNGVRYSCSSPAGGATKITVDGRKKGGLRDKLGTTLELGVVRAPTAPANGGKLTFGFG